MLSVSLTNLSQRPFSVIGYSGYDEHTHHFATAIKKSVYHPLWMIY